MKTKTSTFYQLALLGLFLTFLYSCNISVKKSSLATDNISIAEEEKEIKNTLIAMWKAIENEDIEAYASFVHEDFTQFGETDSVLRVGKAAEIQGISGWISTADNIQTEMHDPRVTISGSMAYISYYWSDQGTENGSPFATKGKSTRIFVKENGKWLCIHGHYTLLP